VIVDYRNESLPASFEADICIIGTGAAGIAIAHALAGSSLNLCMLESGGLASERESQQLYEGSSVGVLPFDPGISRVRAFGGSCNFWGGGCIPLSQLDLSRREWVPHSGWPLSYAELQPYYERAVEFCQIGDLGFAAGSFLAPLPREPLKFDERKLVNRTFVSAPILFGAAYRAELEQAANIHLLLHANLLELRTTDDGCSVDQAVIGSLGGRRGLVHAHHYVLACGAIENARLLLLSNSSCPHGLGNRHDLVGRYFMEHPSGALGSILTKAADRIARPYDRRLNKDPVPAFPEISLSETAQRTHRLLRARIHPFAMEGPVPKGLQALRALRAKAHKPEQDESEALKARVCAATTSDPSRFGVAAALPRPAARLALEVALGAGDIARAFARKLVDRPAVTTDHVELIGYFEQAPNPCSRVTLGDERDALGQRKVRVDWRLTPLDKYSYRTAAMLCGGEIVRLYGGVFRPAPWLAEDVDTPAQVHGTAHHMGTTRMADSPLEGVVDRDCRVHGVDNLHVAGSSVFPTGSWAFPTLTIASLSLRLADRLRQSLVERVAG
jgi:choline dehydrogenase-like flavoprotein